MKPTLLLGAVALLIATPCAAGPRPWVQASSSYNTYAMDDVNAGIQEFNQAFAGTMDEIESAVGFGFSAGGDSGPWSFALGYERLPASTSSNGGYNVAYDIAANTFLARAVYRKPVTTTVGLGFGFGAGIASVSGEAGIETQPFSKGASTQAVIYGPRADLSGTTPCFEGFLEGNIAFHDRFAFVPVIGYRWAKIDAEAEGSEGAATETIDFSGIAARLGLRYSF
jgi:hypothetical protein